MLTRILDFDILKLPQTLSLLFESAVVTPALTVSAHEKTEIRQRIDGTTGGLISEMTNFLFGLAGNQR
jgi:hypothetical protein